MKTVGILIAKENSNRFPDKNIFKVNGKPMFIHNIELMLSCKNITGLCVATDSKIIREYCSRNSIYYINRGVNISLDEQSYLDVLRFAYFSIPEKYDIIVTILCNSIGHTIDAIDKGIEKIISDEAVTEVRSFDKHGNQSGIFIFRADKLPEKWHHMGSIVSNGREIHYREELDEGKNYKI